VNFGLLTKKVIRTHVDPTKIIAARAVRLMQSVNQSFNSSTDKDKKLTIQMNKWRTGTGRLWNTDSHL